MDLSACPASSYLMRAPPSNVHALGQVLCGSAGLAAVGQPGEREHREVARRDDVHVVARSLHEEGSSQVDGFALRRARGSTRAPLSACYAEAGPRRTPQRASPARQPPVRRSDLPSERKDLRSCDPEPRPGHATTGCRTARVA